MPIEATGRITFMAPDNFRADAVINGATIITIRRGSSVRRHIPSRHEIWKYDLKDLPASLPINAGVADVNDPFTAADESSLRYEGRIDLEDGPAHAFSAVARNWARQGVLDTRKGFSITYEPPRFSVRLQLFADAETGLLRRLVGMDKTEKEILRVDYMFRSVNQPVSEALFATDESTAAYRVVDVTDTLLSSLNPDAADAEPSLN